MMNRSTAKASLFVGLILAAGFAATATRAQADLPPDASVEKVLLALESRGRDLRSLAANVTLTQSDDLGVETERTGRLALQRPADGNTKLLVTFTGFKSGKRADKQRRDFLLDGGTLIERDYSAKKETIRKIGGEGKKIDFFKLGEAPFPVPIGQPPQDVLREFNVTSQAPDELDPPRKDLAWVKLVPREKSDFGRRFKYVYIGVDKQGWPVLTILSDPNETEVTRAALSDIRINNDISTDEFKLPPIDDSWDRVE